MLKIVIKTSRLAFVSVYAFCIILTLLFFFFEFHKISIYLNLVFLFVMLSIATYPEYFVFYYTFMIDRDRIIQISGFLDKKKIVVPITSVAHVTLNKTFLGRIFNYGDVFVAAFADTKVIIRGVKRPDELVSRIETMMEKYRYKTDETEMMKK